jgi:predicted nucleic acid-binding protein
LTSIIVSDTSVLINFLKINRLDLLGNCSIHFLVTDHVRGEITNSFPEQIQSFQSGLEQHTLEEITVAEVSEIEIFSTLMKQGKLGIGECSAIALAIHRKLPLAIDDNVAIKSTRSLAPNLPILRTQDLMVKMIQEGVLNISDADSILQDWAINHCFKMKFRTFKELIT